MKEKYHVVTQFVKTKLFTDENVKKMAESDCRLVYTVEGIVPDTELAECSTIAIALTPKEAVKICRDTRGDFISVWVIKGGQSVANEKWEPGYFEEQFAPREDSGLVNEAGGPGLVPDEEEPEEEDMRTAYKLPPISLVNQAVMYILKCADMLLTTIAHSSFDLGHPIDVNRYCDQISKLTAMISHDLIFSKGDRKPKYKEVDGIRVPFWSRKQIADARIDPEDFEY